MLSGWRPARQAGFVEVLRWAETGCRRSSPTGTVHEVASLGVGASARSRRLGRRRRTPRSRPSGGRPKRASNPRPSLRLSSSSLRISSLSWRRPNGPLTRGASRPKPGLPATGTVALTLPCKVRHRPAPRASAAHNRAPTIRGSALPKPPRLAGPRFDIRYRRRNRAPRLDLAGELERRVVHRQHDPAELQPIGLPHPSRRESRQSFA